MEKNHNHLWFIILALVIVISAVGTISFLYYTTTQSSIPPQTLTTSNPDRIKPTTRPTVKPSPTSSEDPAITQLKKTENLDTLESIQKDLDITKLDNLDQEIPLIEEALQ